MVIITGLGRCGTSVLAKYLQLVGFGLGYNVNWHTEARAGLELSTAYTLTSDLYTLFLDKGQPVNLEAPALGDYWKGLTYAQAIRKVDKDEKRQGKIDVIKDPRLTWHPDLIKAWWHVRPDFKLIICHRKIEDVYKSRKSLPPRYDDPKRKELDEYKIDFAEFFTMVLELKIPYQLLYFPRFLFDFVYVHKALSNVGLHHSYEKGKKIWSDLIAVPVGTP